MTGENSEFLMMGKPGFKNQVDFEMNVKITDVVSRLNKSVN